MLVYVAEEGDDRRGAFCAGCPSLLLLDLSYKTALVFAESLAVLGLVAMMEVAGQRRREGEDRGGDA